MSPVLAGWLAVALSCVFAVVVGPILDRRLKRLEDDWKNETAARCNGRPVQTSTAVKCRAGRRA